MNFYELIAPAYYDVYEDMKAGGHAQYWLKGGRGSCKSSFAALVILRGMLADPDANAAVYRRVAWTLRDSVCASFARAIRLMGLEALFRQTQAPAEITYLPTGQKVLFRGADDPGKSKSITCAQGHFAYLWFEEMDEFRSEEDLRSIIQSVLRGGDRTTVIGTFNPPRDARHWINRACLTPRPDRLTLHTSYLDVPPEWLGAGFLAEAEALKKLNPRAYENEYLGKITGCEGRVFQNAQLRAFREGEINGADREYCGLDFGFASDPDAFTRWGYDRKNRTLYALDEFVAANLSTAALAEELKKRAGKQLITCDSADPRMIAELRSLGLNVCAARKGPGSREHGFRWLATLAAIVADPARTPCIAQELSAYEYARDARGEYVNAYPDGGDHTIDAARYAMEREMQPRQARFV